MPTFTPRRQLPIPIGSDAPDAPAAFGALANALDNVAIDLFGTAGDRPGALSAKDDGTLYYATDTKVVSRYRHGTGWEAPWGVRGKSIVATQESRTDVNYGLMPTPDRVQNIVVGSDGLLCPEFFALWKESIAGQAFAAIFVDGDQVQVFDTGGFSASNNIGAISGGTADRWTALATNEIGLWSMQANAALSSAPSLPPAFAIGVRHNTIPAWGGACRIATTPGTHDVSIRFKAASGTVTVRNRKLWVWTLGF